MKRSLISYLSTTQTALDRCDAPQALASREAFQNKLQVLIRASQTGLRDQLVRSAQGLINPILSAQALQDVVACVSNDDK